MDRRELLKMVALLTGGAVIGGEVFLSGCNNTDTTAKTTTTEGAFSNDDIAYLDEVAETILPKTNTPGAKDAKVGAFMTVMVTDCYPEADQKIFREGMKKLDDASNKANSTGFMKATPEQRKNLLVQLDKEAKDYNKNKKPEDPNHYFSMIKQLTLMGYFTSKPGATEALRYVAVPGKYEGCIPYKKGDKAWAT
ncbi:MAG: gluconate 2-dehydrogenase subunit 3 family protein [Bacteroidetes bacterium]|nr:gluconate 2-dehydrogenase subunit 3 family protein [Bacteroidota bacterium]MBS1609885.1 gluconate 2-dehydrogenase subunit 3 family protein [Bacteroidota bacterium]